MTDRRTDTVWQQRPRLCIASRGKNYLHLLSQQIAVYEIRQDINIEIVKFFAAILMCKLVEFQLNFCDVLCFFQLS